MSYFYTVEIVELYFMNNAWQYLLVMKTFWPKLQVINKTDLAAAVGTDLAVMERMLFESEMEAFAQVS